MTNAGTLDSLLFLICFSSIILFSSACAYLCFVDIVNFNATSNVFRATTGQWSILFHHRNRMTLLRHIPNSLHQPNVNFHYMFWRVVGCTKEKFASYDISHTVWKKSSELFFNLSECVLAALYILHSLLLDKAKKCKRKIISCRFGLTFITYRPTLLSIFLWLDKILMLLM